MGSGTDGQVDTLTVYNGDLIAGGYFTIAGGVECNCIARWDGAAWHPLGSGMNMPVRALMVHANALIAGGQFSVAGGEVCNRIARWNGAAWQPIDGGTDGEVLSLVADAGDLFAGGSFASAGGLPVANVATWQCLYVPELCVDTTMLDVVCNEGVGAPPEAFAVWNCGADGTVLDYTLSDDVDWLECIPADGTSAGEHDVIAVQFTTWDLPAGAYSANITIMDPAAGYESEVISVSLTLVPTPVECATEWHTLGGGVSDPYEFGVYALTEYGGDLIAGGTFRTAGDQDCNGIARWNGSIWQSLGSGFDDGVRSLIVHNGQLIAGGIFWDSGGASCECIAWWTGSSWQQLGSGLQDWVTSLATYDDELIASGSFTRSGDTECLRVARWNGSSWEALGGGANQSVFVVTVRDDELIAGGDFTTIGGVTCSRVARWNGTDWQPLGSGVDGTVYALVVYDDKLIVGGNFTTAGGVPCGNIASWNGESWQAFGAGANYSVTALVVYGGELFVGGNFTSIDGIECQRIARWDGSTWRTVGPGMGKEIGAIALFNDELIAGGKFNHVGGMWCNGIARCHPCQMYQVPGDFSNIQSALNAAQDTDIIELTDQTYIGSDNRNLDFLGKRVVLRSASDDPMACVIDCLGLNRGFRFHSGETSDTLLQGVTITGGQATQGGGIYCNNASPKIVNCIVRDNTAIDEGGGVYCEGSVPILSNCLFESNAATLGGGLAGYDSDPVLANCSLGGNTASVHGGGFWLGSSSPVVTNSILWGNSPQELYLYSGEPTITFCDVQGGWPGEGNRDLDPLWVDPTAGDFHLLEDSPCLDLGNNSALGMVGTDLDGNARVAHCRVDLGVYESPYFLDCNDNGIGDACDIADGTSLDENGDGVPDECEVPEICRAPTELAPTCLVSQDADPQTFDVWNCGAQTLEYEITDNVEWLDCLATSGDSAGPDDVDTITVSYSTTELPCGLHTATITISDTAGSAEPQTIDITLTVTGEPAIAYEPTAVSAWCDVGADATDQVLKIWNAGLCTLDYTLAASDDLEPGDWLSCEPTEGSSTDGAHQTHTIHFATAGLAKGDYTGWLTIGTPDDPNSPRNIPIGLTVGGFDVGGVVFSNMDDVLGSGVEGVEVTVTGPGGPWTRCTAGEQGLWEIHNVPQGEYSVMAAKDGCTFAHVVGYEIQGPPPITIQVDDEHEGAIGSIKFLATCDPRACCLGGTTCIDNVAEQACVDFGGTYQGNGSTCAAGCDYADCNANGVWDAVDIEGCTSADCQPNGVPDECDVDPSDPDGNGLVSPDADGDGVPDECVGPPLCAGDVNCDGVVDYGDIDYFVAALSCVGGDPSCWPPGGVPVDCPWLNGDCNGDGNVTYADIDPFVARIGATCP